MDFLKKVTLLHFHFHLFYATFSQKINDKQKCFQKSNVQMWTKLLPNKLKNEIQHGTFKIPIWIRLETFFKFFRLPGVNFIKVFTYEFFIQTLFRQLFLVRFWLWWKNLYGKRAQKTLMKLTAWCQFHQRFTCAFFLQKILAPKNYKAETKLHVKCWWNWRMLLVSVSHSVLFRNKDPCCSTWNVSCIPKNISFLKMLYNINEQKFLPIVNTKFFT